MFGKPPGQASALNGAPCLISGLVDGQVLVYHAATNTWINANPTASGVASLNALTGTLSIVAGTGIGVVAGGSSITISNTSPAPTPAASVTGPDAFGASAVVGVSLLYARQDHDHGIPPTPVTSAIAGTGIGVSGATGAVTFSNTGVLSLQGSTGALTLTAGTGVTITGLTITNAGVTSAVAGTGIGVSGATGAVTFSNTGVTSNVAGTGISVSGATGAVTITNTGVTSAVAGNGVSVSAATGAVTFAAVLNGTTLLNGASGLSLNLAQANVWTAAQRVLIPITALSSGSPYTVLSTDEVLLITTGASAYTVNLPAASTAGRKVLVIKVDSGAGAITVTPNGSDTIEGAATKVISSQYGKVGIVSDGTATWYDLGSGGV